MFNERDRIKISDSTGNIIATVSQLTNANPLAVSVVDASGTQITSFGGGTQYAEGATAATATGTVAMWKDAANTIRAITVAKPLPIQFSDGTNLITAGDNANNAVRVNIVAGAGSGGTAMTDDDAFTVGTTSFTPSGGTYKSTRDAVDDNDGGAFAMTAKRGLYVSLETPLADSAMDDTNDCVKTSVVVALPAGANAIGKLAANDGVDIGDVTINNASLAVTVAASATNIAKAEDAASADGDVGVPSMAVRKATPANTSGADGDYEMLQISAGRLWTSATIDTALPAGANTIGALVANQSVNVAQLAGTATAVNTGNASNGVLRVVLATDQPQLTNSLLVSQATASNLNAQVVGNIAHDGADSGNPVKIGGKARQTNPTAVADADRADLFMDDVGRPVVLLNQCRDLTAVQQTTITASTSETTIVTAVGVGVFADLTNLTITNSSATALIVTLKDSTAGTTRGIYALAANGGIVISFPTPLAQASSNNNWTLTCGTSVSSIYVVAQYVKNV